MRPLHHRPCLGFTMIELVIVLAIVSILALMVVPTYVERIVREEVLEAKKLATVAMKSIDTIYSGKSGLIPVDNVAAGMPPPDKMVSNLVSAVTVVDGAVTITFGNHANKALDGKKLTWRPAISRGFSVLPIEWLCNEVPPHSSKELLGKNETNIENKYLPMECRPPPAKS